MNSQLAALLQPIEAFLHCATPDEWLEEASKPERLQHILIDHANCELKAAQSAALLLRRYVLSKCQGDSLQVLLRPYEDLVYRGHALPKPLAKFDLKSLQVEQLDDFELNMLEKMRLLINEELHHFEQVIEIMHELGFNYQPLNAGRYAKGLLTSVRHSEPYTLIDKLIVGAFIEARSCERFAKLAERIAEQQPKLAKFYISLLRSEARHYQDYLALAEQLSENSLAERIALIGAAESELITSKDPSFRFHSGVPH